MTETPKESPSVGEFIAGMAIGLVAGAVVSLLYAPKSGKETREEMLARLDTLKNQVEETAKKVAGATQSRIAEARTDLSQAVEAGRAAASSRAAELRKQLE